MTRFSAKRLKPPFKEYTLAHEWGGGRVNLSCIICGKTYSTNKDHATDEWRQRSAISHRADVLDEIEELEERLKQLKSHGIRRSKP
jgi:beta-phosphoglucomutase-like phosphatase (HAD superfamily)